MRPIRRKMSNQSGFTIIELMITLLILGILVSIVVLTMHYSQSRAQESACKANLRTIFDAVTVYQSLHDGERPPDLDSLVTDQLMKSSFTWMCPAGDLGATSGDYRNYYTPADGHVSCPRAGHNP
ncbi:MAG: competence type IV pilus major pilin ComGC [Candidatus Geothermincolia bacterium]